MKLGLNNAYMYVSAMCTTNRDDNFCRTWEWNPEYRIRSYVPLLPTVGLYALVKSMVMYIIFRLGFILQHNVRIFFHCLGWLLYPPCLLVHRFYGQII